MVVRREYGTSLFDVQIAERRNIHWLILRAAKCFTAITRPTKRAPDKWNRPPLKAILRPKIYPLPKFYLSPPLAGNTNRWAALAQRSNGVTMLFSVCPICDTQSDIEWRDFCPCCGYEWTSKDILSSLPVPISRPTQLAPDAGDSAVSTSLVQASADTTSQAESAPTQRG